MANWHFINNENKHMLENDTSYAVLILQINDIELRLEINTTALNSLLVDFNSEEILDIKNQLNELQLSIGGTLNDVMNLINGCTEYNPNITSVVSQLQSTLTELQSRLESINTFVTDNSDISTIRQDMLQMKTDMLSHANFIQTFADNVEEEVSSFAGVLPIGGIIMWSGSLIPTGWALCDGTVVNGITTPDLRGKFILGFNGGHNFNSEYTINLVGESGGKQYVSLTLENIPEHSHNYIDSHLNASIDESSKLLTGNIAVKHIVSNSDSAIIEETKITDGAGEGTPVDIMPPYYVLAFIMRVK